jgi:hypothetical protein
MEIDKMTEKQFLLIVGPRKGRVLVEAIRKAEPLFNMSNFHPCECLRVNETLQRNVFMCISAYRLKEG